MASKAVFVDRDKTLMEDPGYISDPQAVKLLPGVELAIKSLNQAGYKVIVVTNQSGVARGLLTEQTLEEIHAELRRQLHAKGVHLDGIYYCPYHPEGTVEQYAQDSPLRKPKPGMLLKAAEELDIDLKASWMVGDSARDVEAGMRAGCRTIRVRVRSQKPDSAAASWDDDESVQSDFTVRNLVDATRVILREGPQKEPAPPAEETKAPAPAAQAAPQPEAPTATAPGTLDDSQVRQEILRHVRQLAVERQTEDFSFTKLLGGVVQMFALLSLLLTFWRMLQQDQLQAAIFWAIVTVALQTMALTFFMMQRQR